MCSYKWSASGQWIRLVLADRNVEVMDSVTWTWDYTIALLWSFSVKQLVVYQSVSLRCERLERQRGHAQRKALVDVPVSPKCPLREWWYLCKGWISGLFWGTMAQFRIIQSLWLFIVTLSLSFGTLASYAAAPAALYFSFTQITGEDKSRVSDPHSRAVWRHDRRGQKKKNLEFFRNTQRSSSRDAVSQGTFCQWSKREKWKREK